MSAHTPGPWRWQGEDYRGGWGWQLLVGVNGEGIACGERCGHPYEHLQAFQAIDPSLCETGINATSDSAPCIHVQQADAQLIATSPRLLAALEALVKTLADHDDEGLIEHADEMVEARSAIAQAKGTL